MPSNGGHQCCTKGIREGCEKPARLSTSGFVCDCDEEADTLTISISQNICGLIHLSPLTIRATFGFSDSNRLAFQNLPQ